MEHPVDQAGDLLIAIAARASRSQLIVQPRHALLDEALAPFTRSADSTKAAARWSVAGACRSPQYQFGAGYERVRHEREAAKLDSCACSSRLKLSSALGRPVRIHLSLSGRC